MNEWMNEWINASVNEWVNEWMDKLICDRLNDSEINECIKSSLMIWWTINVNE